MADETWAAKSRQTHPDADVQVQIRHGQFGQRALLGTLRMRPDEWREFQSQLTSLGWDVDDHRKIAVPGPSGAGEQGEQA